MPFKSEKQRAWIYKNKPEIAKKWQAETPSETVLPKKAVKKLRVVYAKVLK